MTKATHVVTGEGQDFVSKEHWTTHGMIVAAASKELAEDFAAKMREANPDHYYRVWDISQVLVGKSK